LEALLKKITGSFGTSTIKRNPKSTRAIIKGSKGKKMLIVTGKAIKVKATGKTVCLNGLFLPKL
jgi:hypothetical protein